MNHEIPVASGEISREHSGLAFVFSLFTHKIKLIFVCSLSKSAKQHQAATYRAVLEDSQ
jgi:hypothetical protein